MRNTTHTKVSKAALGGWKVDPDQDRHAGEVKEYTLTPEELEKYGPPSKKRPPKGGKSMYYFTPGKKEG